MIAARDQRAHDRAIARQRRKAAKAMKRKRKADARIAAYQEKQRDQAISGFVRAVKAAIRAARRQYRQGGSPIYIDRAERGWLRFSEQWNFDPATVAASVLPEGWSFNLVRVERDDGAFPRCIRVVHPATR